MHAETTRDYRRARQAYEYGRFRSSIGAALLVALAVAAVGLATSGWSSLMLLPVTVGIWIFVYWRGMALLRGAYFGLVGGLVTTLLPMSILRPCCGAGAASGPCCCTMPSACLAAGVVVGVVLAVVVPFRSTSRWPTALGMVLGMTSVAILKCATLFAGEAFGLVGGLVAGLAAASAAKLFLATRSAA